MVKGRFGNLLSITIRTEGASSQSTRSLTRTSGFVDGTISTELCSQSSFLPIVYLPSQDDNCGFQKWFKPAWSHPTVNGCRGQQSKSYQVWSLSSCPCWPPWLQRSEKNKIRRPPSSDKWSSPQASNHALRRGEYWSVQGHHAEQDLNLIDCYFSDGPLIHVKHGKFHQTYGPPLAVYR